ncbi:hypothetical protein FU659_20035 [Paenibacillus sp. N3.4]|nr:hypothetical protein FU659_20035 [Paenibacillus sp. N3.4]
MEWVVWTHLLKYDTVHRGWDANISVSEGKLIINENVINIVSERNFGSSIRGSGRLDDNRSFLHFRAGQKDF